MKLIITGACALALSACAGITDQTGLTATEQQCLASNSLIAADMAKDLWGDMTTPQKAAYLAIAADDVATVCAVDASAIKPYLTTVIQAAAVMAD